MRINGWHRLWILASFLALASCALFIGKLWPEEASIVHSIAFYDALDPNARAQIAENESAPNVGVRMPNGHIIYLKPEVAVSRKSEALIQYHRAVTAELRSKQWQLLFQAIGIWFASCIAVLALGHLVTWVIRGFREGADKPLN